MRLKSHFQEIPNFLTISHGNDGDGKYSSLYNNLTPFCECKTLHLIAMKGKPTMLLINFYNIILLAAAVTALSLRRIVGVFKPTVFSELNRFISSLLRPPSQPTTIESIF